MRQRHRLFPRSRSRSRYSKRPRATRFQRPRSKRPGSLGPTERRRSRPSAASRSSRSETCPPFRLSPPPRSPPKRLPAEAPEAYAPSFEDDEFPAPVVASELAQEQSFDFGIDVDAELALAGEEPLEFEPLAEAPLAERPAEPVPSPPAFSVPAPNAPEAAPEAPVEAFTPPEGAEDLTVISSIDEDTQRALYMSGVHSLDEIARWGRTDARRVASEVGVSEETIMHQWVFEAQAALFDRYSRR